MNCPKCKSADLRVNDSRERKRVNGWVRYRQCNSCGYAFRTIERYSFDTLQEIDQSRLTARKEQKRENVRRIRELAKKMSIKLAED